MGRKIKSVLSLIMCVSILYGVAPLGGFQGLRFGAQAQTYDEPDTELIENYIPEEATTSPYEESTTVAQEESTTARYESTTEPYQTTVNPDSTSTTPYDEPEVRETETIWDEMQTVSKDCGDNARWTLDPVSGLLTIDGTGDPYFDLGFYKSYVRRVIIYKGITSVPSYAFSGCYYLESVSIPDTVKTIGISAFSYCRSLESIIIPEGVTSIGAYAFASCENIRSIEIPDSIRSIGESVFEYCYNIKSVEIPDNVTAIESNAFRSCQSLESVTLPEGLKSIGAYAFAGCDLLSDISIPQGVTLLGDGAFGWCFSLKSISIPSALTFIGENPFTCCWELETITVDVNNTSYCADSHGVLFNKDKTVLIQYPPSSARAEYVIPDSVKTICDFSFAYSKNLENIHIPDSVISIGTGAFSECINLKISTVPVGITVLEDEVFYGCSGIADFSVPSSVESIGGSAFGSCVNLKNISLPYGLTCVADAAFAWCYSLEEIEIPYGVTSIGNNAFRECENLKKVTFPDTVQSIGNSAFYGCKKLEKLDLPDSLISVGESAFIFCNNVKTVSVGKNIAYIGFGAFVASGIEKFVVSSDNAYFSADSDGVLYNKDKTVLVLYPCANPQTSYTIPETVTELADGSMMYTQHLRVVTISENVKKMGDFIFNGAEKLSVLKFSYFLPQLPDIAFDNFIESGIIDITLNGHCGENLTWSLAPYTGVFAIDGTGSMDGWVCGPDAPWYDYASFVTAVVVKDGITSVPENAFADFENLEYLHVADTVTQIGDNILYGNYTCICSDLSDNCAEEFAEKNGLEFRECSGHYTDGFFGGECGANTRWIFDANTGVFTITGNGAVEICDWHDIREFERLAGNVVIGDGVTSICEYAFLDYYNLKTVTIPDSVTSIGYGAFNYCNSLTDVCYGSTQDDWNKISIDSYNECLTCAVIHFSESAHTHSYGWIVVTEPTAIQDGLKNKICSVCGEAAESIVIPATGFEPINGLQIDHANNIVYGLAPGAASLDSYTDVVVEGAQWVYTGAQNGFGTGTVAKLELNGETFAEYTVVIFGDIEGNGWYDANDAFIVNMIANNLISADSLSEAESAAADCNHDGVINELDFELLIRASVLLEDVDQSAAQAELERNAIYITYCSLIDQAAGDEATPDFDGAQSESTAPDKVNSAGEINIEAVFTAIFEFVRKIFAFVFSFMEPV